MVEHEIENELANIVKCESKESVQHGFDEQTFSGRKKMNGVHQIEGTIKNSREGHPFEQTDYMNFREKDKLVKTENQEQDGIVDEQQGDYKNSIESLNNS